MVFVRTNYRENPFDYLISNGKDNLGVIDRMASAGFIKSGRCFFFCHAKIRKMQEFRENPIYLI